MLLVLDRQAMFTLGINLRPVSEQYMASVIAFVIEMLFDPCVLLLLVRDAL